MNLRDLPESDVLCHECSAKGQTCKLRILETTGGPIFVCLECGYVDGGATIPPEGPQ